MQGVFRQIRGSNRYNIRRSKQITTTKERKKDKKYIYGEFKHVKLTETEYKNLVVEYGEEKTITIITYLDEYMEMKDKKYKSCYLAIKKWVVDAVEQNNKKSSRYVMEYESRGRYKLRSIF